MTHPLQVWLKNDGEKPFLVGQLSGLRGPFREMIELRRDSIFAGSMDYEDLPGPSDDVAKTRTFRLQTRAWKRDGLDLLRNKHDFMLDQARHVPDYAVQLHDPRRDEISFRWTVLQLNVEEYEWVFDLASFEARDTESDTKMLAEEAMAKELRYRMDAAISSAFLGADSYGAPSSFPSSATSANSSAIDMEKMNEAMRLMAADGVRYVSSGHRYGKTIAMEEKIRSYSPALNYEMPILASNSLWKISGT